MKKELQELKAKLIELVSFVDHELLSAAYDIDELPFVPDPPEDPAYADLPLKTRVVLEIGHGPHPDGAEPGAVDSRTGTEEHDMNRVCAEACAKQLREYGFHNVTTTDSGDYLGAIGEEFSDCDIFISCHHNAFDQDSAQGAEVLMHDKLWSSLDESFALLLSETLADGLQINNRGVKQMSLSVLRGAIQGTPTKRDGRVVVLVEPYFITGKTVDNHEDWSRKSGELMAIAIRDWLGGKRAKGDRSGH